jgi:hypothetical protein
MKKIYEKPQMEAMDIKMQGFLTGSSVTGVKDFNYKGAGTGGGRAPFQQEWEEELDALPNFDDILF